MHDTSAYGIRITHAGRELATDEAVRYVTEGSRVTVTAVRGDIPLPGLAVHVAIHNDSDAEPRARVDYSQIASQETEGAAVIFRVARMAARLAEAVDEFLISHHYAAPHS